ncbi:hypothetical protein VTJ04DRAFT_1288 [Mycothermus thermophilus]|uniref:uncharacterized protein n=1 Tax=Humicola insolens TaxID=85995 RepID=UPI0037447322
MGSYFSRISKTGGHAGKKTNPEKGAIISLGNSVANTIAGNTSAIDEKPGSATIRLAKKTSHTCCDEQTAATISNARGSNTRSNNSHDKDPIDNNVRRRKSHRNKTCSDDMRSDDIRGDIRDDVHSEGARGDGIRGGDAKRAGMLTTHGWIVSEEKPLTRRHLVRTLLLWLRVVAFMKRGASCDTCEKAHAWVERENYDKHDAVDLLWMTQEEKDEYWKERRERNKKNEDNRRGWIIQVW